MKNSIIVLITLIIFILLFLLINMYSDTYFEINDEQDVYSITTNNKTLIKKISNVNFKYF